MTDRPIIFSAPMVLALLAGRKTQTRRLATSPLRRVEVGDRLYVREAWASFWATEDQKPRDIDPDLWSVRYLADDHVRPASRDGSLAVAAQCKPGRPSIHMPRWASRLTLIVEQVRVEPLREISEADAEAEGVERGEHPITGNVSGWKDYSIIHAGPHKGKRHPHAIAPWKSAALSFQSLWETLHGEQSWRDNPDVVALTFRVIQGNIDRSQA